METAFRNPTSKLLPATMSPSSFLPDRAPLTLVLQASTATLPKDAAIATRHAWSAEDPHLPIASPVEEALSSISQTQHHKAAGELAKPREALQRTSHYLSSARLPFS